MNYLKSVRYIIALPVGAALIGAPYYFPKESLATLVAVWFMFIPVALIGFFVYGIILYFRNMKHKNTLSIKPTEAIIALASRDAELHDVKRSP